MKENGVAAVLAIVLCAGSVMAADWPGYRGENAAGVSERQGSAPELTADRLKEAWRVTPGESFSEFAVVGDNALVFVMSTQGESVVCLDVGTGKTGWVAPVEKGTSMDGNGKGPRATPAIANGKAYVFSSFMNLV